MFFDTFTESGIGEIKTQNLYNYDEMNFVNDVGKSWLIVGRGRRRVEVISDNTKQAYSVMWCGSAAGQPLPPMVIYKSKNVYTNWIRGSPEGSVFACSDSRMVRLCFIFSIVHLGASITECRLYERTSC